MRARPAIVFAVAGLALVVAAQALAEPPANPPTRDLPQSDESFQSGTPITFQATTAPPAQNEMDFYISSNPDTNSKGVLSKNVDIVGGQLVSGDPITGTVHTASWSGEQPGTYHWQAVYIDCAQDLPPDCLNQSTTGSFNITAIPAAAITSATQIETFLDRHPRRRTQKRRVKFRFSSNVAGASFRCLFARGWADCKSPHVFRHLEPGRYKFKARAVVNGLEDPTPVSWVFRILPRD